MRRKRAGRKSGFGYNAECAEDCLPVGRTDLDKCRAPRTCILPQKLDPVFLSPIGVLKDDLTAMS